LVLHKPPLRRLLVLDESFRFVSKEFRPGIAQLLEELSGELGVQIISVSHIPELEVGKVIRMGEGRE
jgi:ABC-type molybdenum transport system ATPase subunit/photorepair protein PhrA